MIKEMPENEKRIKELLFQYLHQYLYQNCYFLSNGYSGKHYYYISAKTPNVYDYQVRNSTEYLLCRHEFYSGNFFLLSYTKKKIKLEENFFPEYLKHYYSFATSPINLFFELERIKKLPKRQQRIEITNFLEKSTIPIPWRRQYLIAIQINNYKFKFIDGKIFELNMIYTNIPDTYMIEGNLKKALTAISKLGGQREIKDITLLRIETLLNCKLSYSSLGPRIYSIKPLYIVSEKKAKKEKEDLFEEVMIEQSLK